MLKIENAEIMGWEHAIRGMRNPKNSWMKSDSGVCATHGPAHCADCVYTDCHADDVEISTKYILGSNDLNLMTTLRNAGTDHRKFMRMITVYLDITAPLYWWKEFDTYKVGTVANSCSTMHKIAAKEFTLEDFSYEHLIDKEVFAYPLGGGWRGLSPIEILNATIELLNNARKYYLSMEKQKVPKASEKAKEIWWQMIQLLPSSSNQRRTVMLNYEVLANIYKSRRNHKLDEWHTFCDWIEGLPYNELITGPSLKDIPIRNEITEEAKRRVHEELNAQFDHFCKLHEG